MSDDDKDYKQNELTVEDNFAISKSLERIAKMIDKRLVMATGGKKVPFSLYTWGGSRAQYVSNTHREDAKACMEELLSSWEIDDGPFHEFN